MIKSIFSCFAVLLMWTAAAPARALAQEAPPRFKQFAFPHGLKSLHPYGDTIILVGKEDFEVTTDGGKTWDLIARDSSKKILAHPNYPILYYTEIKPKDTLFRFYLSKDLGRSFELREISKDTIAEGLKAGYSLHELSFSPWDANWIYSTATGSGIAKVKRLDLL